VFDGAMELAAAGYAWEIEDAHLLHADLSLVDLNHVLTLINDREIPSDPATALVHALLDLVGSEPSAVEYVPELGEPYLAREAHLEGIVGAHVGWLRAGRTRREAVRTAHRMVVRRGILDLVDAGCAAVDALVVQARRHATTVAPDHTYLQVAEPTSFGHYILGFAHGVLRDLYRLQAEFPHVNLSPVGSGAVAGSEVLRDRERLGYLLGFDGPTTHIRDGMWQSDPMQHAVLAATTLTLGLDRLAEDLEILASAEFGLVRLGDGLVRSSVMMPQKRNPYALTVVRGTAGILIGRSTGQLAISKAPSARSDSAIYSYGEVPRSLDLATRATRLMAAVVRTLEVDVDAMRRSASERSLQATTIATALMRSDDLDYRTSHGVVARALVAASTQGVPISLEHLAQARGDTVALTPADFAAACDPDQTVQRRHVLGGSADESVIADAGSVEVQSEEIATWSREARHHITTAEALTVQEARQVLVQCESGIREQGDHR